MNKVASVISAGVSIAYWMYAIHTLDAKWLVPFAVFVFFAAHWWQAED